MAYTQMEMQMRFAARNSIASIGQGSGETFAVDAATGFARGCADELVTMLGRGRAFEIMQAITDEIVAAGAKKYWAAKKD